LVLEVEPPCTSGARAFFLYCRHDFAKTAKLVAEAYTLAYSYYSHPLYYLNRDKLHDFLYEEDYESWFLNLIKRMSEHALNNRELKEFLMRLHTGESVVATQWTWEDQMFVMIRKIISIPPRIFSIARAKMSMIRLYIASARLAILVAP
jgi:hypothetical protein